MGTDAAAWCHPFLASPSRNKQELLGLIVDYRQGLVPLIVPLTLRKNHLTATQCLTGFTSRCICIRTRRS